MIDPLADLPVEARERIAALIASGATVALRFHVAGGKIVAVTAHAPDDESGTMLWALTELGDRAP